MFPTYLRISLAINRDKIYETMDLGKINENCPGRRKKNHATEFVAHLEDSRNFLIFFSKLWEICFEIFLLNDVLPNVSKWKDNLGVACLPRFASRGKHPLSPLVSSPTQTIEVRQPALTLLGKHYVIEVTLRTHRV